MSCLLALIISAINTEIKMTFRELCDRLKMIDEVLLLEILDISSEEIVDRFEDFIEIKRDQIEEDLEVDDIYEPFK